MATKEMTAAETKAATDALQGMIDSKLPDWQRRLVPQALLVEAVQAVVAAVDKVRDGAA